MTKQNLLGCAYPPMVDLKGVFLDWYLRLIAALFLVFTSLIESLNEFLDHEDILEYLGLVIHRNMILHELRKQKQRKNMTNHVPPPPMKCVFLYLIAQNSNKYIHINTFPLHLRLFDFHLHLFDSRQLGGMPLLVIKAFLHIIWDKYMCFKLLTFWRRGLYFCHLSYTSISSIDKIKLAQKVNLV